MSKLVPNSTMEDAIATWVESAGVPSFWADQDRPRPPAPYVELSLVVEPTGPDWRKTTPNPLVFADKVVTSADATTNRLLVTAHGLATGDGPVQTKNTGGALPAPLVVLTDYWIIRDDADHVRLATSLALANAGTAVDLADAGTGATTLASTAATVKLGAEVTNTSRGMRRCRLTLQCFATSPTGTSRASATLTQIQALAALPTRVSALRAAGVGVPVFGAVSSAGQAQNFAHFEPRAVLEAYFFAEHEVSETGTFVERASVTGQVVDLPEFTILVPEA